MQRMDTSHRINPSDIINATDDDLKYLTTAHALDLYRRFTRSISFIWCDIERGYASEDSQELKDYQAASARLQKLLATRPHVPNKKEGKALRREAAKRKR
jgi:hypothetical protein